MTERQQSYLINLAGRPGSSISQETIEQMRAEVKKLMAGLDELEDSLDATARRVNYLETQLEDMYEDCL